MLDQFSKGTPPKFQGALLLESRNRPTAVVEQPAVRFRLFLLAHRIFKHPGYDESSCLRNFSGLKNNRPEIKLIPSKYGA
jgi:hypothetical protein